jgi:hypothetical protein
MSGLEGFPTSCYDGFWGRLAQCIAECRVTESPRGSGRPGAEGCGLTTHSRGRHG